MSKTVTIYTAKRCAPCNILKVELKKDAKFKYELVDIEENPKKAQEARIRSVPTIIVEDSETGITASFIGASVGIVKLIEKSLEEEG